MKTNLILLFCLINFGLIAQIPSINETRSDIDIRYKKNKAINIIEIKKELEKLEDEKKAIFTTESIENNSKNIQKMIDSFSIKNEKIEKLNLQIKEYQEKNYSKEEIYMRYYDKEILKIFDEIDKILVLQKKNTNNLNEIESYQLRIDAKKVEISDLQKQRAKKLKSLTYSWFLPTINKEKRSDFFKLTYNNLLEKTNYVNSFSVQGNEDGFLAQSEIITDNLNAFRVSFGTVINSKTNNKEEETSTTDQATKNSDIFQKDAVNRLVNGGGNLYIDLILPLITTYDGSASDYLTSYTYFNTRAAMDVKGFGNNIDTSTGNGSFGFNSYASISSDTKKFNFFVQGSVNYNFGSNDYYKNLGIKNEQGFLNGKVIVGVGLLNHFKVTAIVNTFGSDEKLRSGKVNIGIQVLPGN